MALEQERATLYDTVFNSPHKTLIWSGSDGTLHLAFYNQWDSWHTPCKINLRGQPMETLRYGKPTCFECFIDDEDPTKVGRSSRNALKLCANKRGNHWYVVMFAGPVNETMANVGGVTMLDFEWREFAAAVVIGARTLGMKVIIEKEES